MKDVLEIKIYDKEFYLRRAGLNSKDIVLMKLIIALNPCSNPISWLSDWMCENDRALKRQIKKLESKGLIRTENGIIYPQIDNFNNLVEKCLEGGDKCLENLNLY